MYNIAYYNTAYDTTQVIQITIWNYCRKQHKDNTLAQI